MGATTALSTELRHARFVEEFFVDFDSERAYLAAGYTAKVGHSRLVSVGGLLANPDVQTRMREKLQELRRKVDLDQQTHAVEVCRLAYSDMREVAEWDGSGVRVKPSHEISEAAARTIQKVTSRTRTRRIGKGDDAELVTETEVDVQLHSKNAALDLLQRMYHSAQALRTELMHKLQALAQLAARYVPEDQLPRFLAEARIILGDFPDEPPHAAR